MFSQIQKLLSFSDVKIDLKNNAFDFVRLVAALFVVFGHSGYLYGSKDFLWEAKYFDNLHSGTLAVWTFFGISGYLVTASWLRSDGIIDFVVKRYKRIFPGFWTSILVCGLFFVPLWYFIRNGNLNDFWTINGLDLWKFLSSNLDSEIKVNSVGKVAIDGINGPWWTIHHELRAYIALGVLGFLGFLKEKNKWVILSIAIFMHLVRISYSFNLDFAKTYDLWFGDERILLYLSIFFWGSTMQLFKDKIKINYITFVLAIFAMIFGTIYDFLPVVFPLAFAYIVISLSFIIPIKNISKKIGDLSYGIYLYHWPVRLTLQMLGVQAMGMWWLISLDLICTIPLALISWNFVEKRFLARHKALEKPLNL